MTRVTGGRQDTRQYPQRSSVARNDAATPRARPTSAHEMKQVTTIVDIPRPDLKTIGGFSVREIARAFLADESAIAQRLRTVGRRRRRAL
jgi:hypothetical protein